MCPFLLCTTNVIRCLRYRLWSVCRSGSFLSLNLSPCNAGQTSASPSIVELLTRLLAAATASARQPVLLLEESLVIDTPLPPAAVTAQISKDQATRSPLIRVSVKYTLTRFLTWGRSAHST